MKCKYCGTEMEPDSLYCPRCGREVRFVPDYNPLDDVLAAQVRESWNQSATTPSDEYAENYSGYGNNAADVRQRGVQNDRRTGNTGRTDRNTGRTSQGRTGGTQGRSQTDEQAYRRRQQARRQERLRQKKQKRRILLISMAAVLAIIITACYLLYQNSYSGLVKSGNAAITKEQYNKAIKKFDKAVSKNGTKGDAYIGLSKVFLAQKDTENAESVFVKAIEKHPVASEIYIAACKFYLDTEQPEKISPMIEECSDSGVLTALKPYTVKKPSSNLKEDAYDDVQELKLSSKGNDIYYTLDGSEPSTSSTKYSDPIQIKEGSTTVKAISYNGKKIPSLIAERTYTITFPTVNAPSVTPSTGRYDQKMQIVITVPDGYTAYYTLDGSEPTSSSEKYTEPIDMPEGSNTIFSAVLIDKNGRVSEVAKRNYDLSIEE